MSKLAKILLFCGALSACQVSAPSLRGNLTVFHQIEEFKGKSLFIEATNREKQDGLEFANYAQIISNKLAQKGFIITDDKNKAELIAKLDYAIDNGTTHVSTYHVPRMGYYGGFNNSPYYPNWMQRNYAGGYSHSNPKWHSCAVGILLCGQEKIAVHSGSMDKIFDEPTAKKYAAPNGYVKSGL